MNSRHQDILFHLVDDYIRTARPVGSTHLVARMRLDASSATMRNILRELDEQHYVYQPHPSAGRIPTDLGYRFYVNRLGVRRPTRIEVRRLRGLFSDYQETFASPARAVAKLLAAMAHSVAISTWLSLRDIHEAGLASLFDQAEHAEETAKEVSDLLDHADQYVAQYATEAADDIQVYIGQENTAFPARHTSVIVRRVARPDGVNIVLVLAGPKRMAYRRNLAVVNGVASVIERGNII